MPGVPCRRSTGRHALGEGRICLISQPVIVLDQVDAARGEARDQIGEPRRRQALRLDRGRRQRPPMRTNPRPQPGTAMPHATEIQAAAPARSASRPAATTCCRTPCSAAARIRLHRRDCQPDAHVEHPTAAIGDVLQSPTIFAKTAASSIAASGISTLCSTAMPCARAAMDAASDRTRYVTTNRVLIPAGTAPPIHPA